MTQMPNSRQVLTDLTDALKRTTAAQAKVNTAQRRLAQVLSFDGSTHTFGIALGGDTANPITGVRCLSNYFPSINQVVWVDIKESDATIVGDATDGAWNTWTATIANGVASTITASKYRRQGQTISFQFGLTVNTSAGTGSTPWSVSLPATPAYNQSGSGYYIFRSVYVSTTAVIDSSGVFYMTQASLASSGLISTDNPDWNSGDQLHIAGTYEVASGH